MCLLFVLKDVLNDNDVKWVKRGNIVRWEMSLEETRHAFDYGCDLDKCDDVYVHYMQQTGFVIKN